MPFFRVRKSVSSLGTFFYTLYLENITFREASSSHSFISIINLQLRQKFDTFIILKSSRVLSISAPSGQRRLIPNDDKDDRVENTNFFHSWLRTMCPRLVLVRDIL
jgi:hypothetical protein